MAPSSTLRRALARRTSERGAVLVEAALAIPLLVILIFGAIEAGMAWEARSSTTSGVRTGLLRAASLGDKPETDLRILQSVVGEIGPDRVGDIGWVVIFDATNPDHDTTVANCAAAAAGGGLSTTCNTYTSAQLSQVVAGTITIADFDNGDGGEPATYTCASGALDSNWCAGSRLGASNAINVGVAVRLNHDWFTGVLPGDGVEFTEYAISSTLTSGQAAPLYTVPPPPTTTTTTTTTTAAPTSSTSSTSSTTTTTAAPTTTTTIAAPSSYTPESMVLSGSIDTGTTNGEDWIEMDSSTNYDSPGSAHADFGFTIVEDETFRLNGDVWRWNTNAGIRDSFWIVIDGDVANAIAWHIGGSVVDDWSAANQSPSFDLTAGSHTVSLYTRERHASIATNTISLDVD